MNFIRNRKGEFAPKRKPMGKWERRFMLSLMVFCFGTIAVGQAWDAWGPKELVAFNMANVAFADELKVVEMRTILHDIADCESGVRNADGSGVEGSARQFYDDGRVVRNYNKDGTVDIGKYQINSIHMAQVVRMNLDVLTEEGNEEFAEYLYELNGTRDWKASRSCWDR